jgi:hypothetical protein
MINALVINLNNNNKHVLGLTLANPLEPKIEGSKFFALKRILDSVEPSFKGMKWLKVPDNTYADFIGFEITEFKNGCHKFRTAYATEMKSNIKYPK